MTANTFRKMALEYKHVVESAHMNHPDFRIDGEIFATLGYPDENSGMVKLTPQQQRRLVKKAPDVFQPCIGAGARPGCTNVHLPSAKKDILRPALNAAFKNATKDTK
jgi:hypothetical protein